MNAIPYFDYSLAPFWPSYQNKVIGVLERALREQSGSRIRRILLRLPWEHDNAFNSRQTWFGMDFIETVSALMNATPGRDLCWLLTRHPEKPEYHVVLCVRQEYFDGPELDRLILDAWSNVLGFASTGGSGTVPETDNPGCGAGQSFTGLRRHPQRLDLGVQ